MLMAFCFFLLQQSSARNTAEVLGTGGLGVYTCLTSFVAFATALPELVYCATGWYMMSTDADGTNTEWAYNLQRFAAARPDGEAWEDVHVLSGSHWA